MTHQRSNQEWLTDLGRPGLERDRALLDLRALLEKGLNAALAQRPQATAPLIEHCVKLALEKIVSQLDAFKNQSQFLTWAQAIAVRMAFSEMHRRQWEEVALQELKEKIEIDAQALLEKNSDPRQRGRQEKILSLLSEVLNDELSDQQRQGLIGAFKIHMPPGESARRLQIDRDAFYLMIHDARTKIKQKLLSAGLAPDEILSSFGLASPPQNH